MIDKGGTSCQKGGELHSALEVKRMEGAEINAVLRRYGRAAAAVEASGF